MNYDDFKNKMNGLDESKRKQVADLMGQSSMDETYKNYWNQYQNEMNNQQPKQNQASNSFSSPETTGQNQQQNQPTYQPQQQVQPVQQQPTYDPNEKLDTNMFGATDGKVRVQEGTAKYTGQADYTLDSDARMQEITNNLNAYRQNNPEYFKDRNTYNQMFHYNERNDSQKALLDSYRKKKESVDTAQKYTTGDSIISGMNDAEITNDQLNYIKEYSPEAYRERQQKQQDEINLRIANLATPSDPTANADLFNSLSKKLNLDPGESYKIYDNWESMCEKLGVFRDSEKLQSYQNQLNQNHQKMEQIMSRYANSAGGTVSDALAAARMQKALAPYQQVEANLQNAYTTLLNGRNSNLAVANQAAQVMQAQAQEDQRIFNQRLQGLGFAMQTASYRTPEQQAQLQLTTQAISNEMNLLQQSKQQDLNLYNQYAGAKLQNQLQNELTDLSVSDPKQLRANLNNALTSYYEQYGDIIQRSQAQVVDDVINYANEHGISVAQALTENFIKPLQGKAEYKQKVANDYGMLSKQSVATINGKSVIMTTNPNGSIAYNYITDPNETSTYVKPYDLVDSSHLSLETGTGTYTLGDFLETHKDGTIGGWCGAFVNDYLEKIGLGRYYDNDLSTKLNSVNTDTPKVGTVAVFDYGHITAETGENHGHVGIVTKVYDDGSFDVTDSNYGTKTNADGTKQGDRAIRTRHVLAGSPSCKGFFDPTQPPRANSNGSDLESSFEWNGNVYNYNDYAGWNELTDDEKITVQNLLTYQTDPSSLPKSGADNGKSNQRVRAAAAAIGRSHGYNERKFAEIKKVEDTWNKANLPGGPSSANSTAMSILKAVSDSFKDLENYDINAVNSWINAFKKETSDPTVGAMYTDMRVAASEIAKALKGGASPTTEEIKDISNLLDGNMGTEQAKAVFRHFAKNLYEKNESEAKAFGEVTGYKPKPIYTDEAAEWLNNSMGVDLSKYYNYQSPVTTGPDDILTKYFDGLGANSNNFENSINFILNG